MAIAYSKGNTDKSFGGGSGAYVPFKADFDIEATRLGKLQKRYKGSFTSDNSGKPEKYCVLMLKEKVGKLLGLTMITEPRKIEVSVDGLNSTVGADGEVTTTKGEQKRTVTVPYKKGASNVFTLVFSKEVSIEGINSKGEKNTKKLLTLQIAVPKFIKVYEFVDFIKQKQITNLVAVKSPDGKRYTVAAS